MTDLFPPDPMQSLVDALPKFPREGGDEYDDLADTLDAYRVRLHLLDSLAKDDRVTESQLRALIRAVQE